MDRSLYVAMSGAKQTLLAQSANANNLANSQTIGFKADFAQFRAQPVFGPGYPSRVYAMTERPGTDVESGALTTTGNPLHIALKGPGWLVVQDSKGQEAYTRSGNLQVDRNGALLTSDGLPVIGDNGPITLPAFDKLLIGSDGTLSIVPAGGNVLGLAVIERLKLVKPDSNTLEKGLDGLLHVKPPAQGSQAPLPAADATVQIIQGALEDSNVNMVAAMVEMLELARNFELQTKVMHTVADDAAASAKLTRLQ